MAITVTVLSVECERNAPLGEPRLDVVRSLLAPLRPGRLLDVATGHGLFALLAHELGWDVTAMDARTERMPAMPGIQWIQGDVRTFDVSGYDVIMILGLLYHLDIDDQVDLLRRCAGTPLILDTHVALKPAGSRSGYRGSVFLEVPDLPPEDHERCETASWGNKESWWTTQEELLRLLRDVGYRWTFPLTPSIRPDRTFYYCLS